MAWLIGIDEAGYGPNLGPLVVAASAWWVEEERSPQFGLWMAEGPASTSVVAVAGRRRSATTCLYRRLSKIVCRAPSERKLAIADSKQLYKPGGGLRQLERGVLVALGASEPWPAQSASDGTATGEFPGGTSPPARWQQLIHHHTPPVACYREYDCQLPIDAAPSEIARLSTRFDSACAAAGVRLCDVRARLVYPRQFNELCSRLGNKASALSHVSIGLLRDVIESLPGRAQSLSDGSTCTHVTCDKHGGRNRYAALLQHYFPDEWIDTLAESGPASRYGWGPPESRTEISFRTGGEAELPVALASMMAKYHRELAMRAFNDFWCTRIDQLRPTAGYPGDARRFKQAINDLQRELQIDDDCLWRWR